MNALGNKLWDVRLKKLDGADFDRPVSVIIPFSAHGELLKTIIPAGTKWLVWLEHTKMKRINCSRTGFSMGNVFYFEVEHEGFVLLSALRPLMDLGNYKLKTDTNSYVEPGVPWLDLKLTTVSVMVYGGDGMYDSSADTLLLRWQMLKPGQSMTIDTTKYKSVEIILRTGKLYFQRLVDPNVITCLGAADMDSVEADQKTELPWVCVGFDKRYTGELIVLSTGTAFLRMSTRDAPFYFAVDEISPLHPTVLTCDNTQSIVCKN